MPNQPSGARHEVGVDELFFSTTDARGVIKRANNVFVRLSHFEADELSQAPHNLIRHPAMPAGAFHAMWDTLKAGRPFAAYVRNLAGNGSEYRVFATVTPMRNGDYLSVRSRPMRADLEETAYALYEQALGFEQEAAAGGANRRETAAQGAGKLVELLAEAGLDSYEAFQNVALPAEVASWEESGQGLAQRPGTVGPQARALEAVHALSADLDAWMSRLDALADLDHAIKRTSKRLNRAVNNPAISSESVASLDRSDAGLSTLGQLLDLWLQMQGLITPQVSSLQQTLAQMEATVGRTRFRIALARLHASMTATFLAELIDGEASGAEGAGTAASEDSELTRGAINDLGQALREGMEDFAAQTRSYQELAAQTGDAVAQVQRLLAIPHQILELWTNSPKSQDPNLPEAAQSLTKAAAAAVSGSEQILMDLAGLVEQCTSAAVGEDAGQEADLRALVEQVCAAIEAA
ncbi:Aerotaxis receptor [Actinomyces bovis]|uniref:Aerotaxis receptor n=1 Tax=Actinomyces bovis TaxID=1658 RepID=A0ABY1VMV5_9ACTO|nr:PAS domain-containing protein [Actinomyces bovis]SPT53395.1 Aerotaxis receptor [Actinomyces bovis]VEG52807.1 Aerotaxis receptor [Actinomyces israelii]